MSIYRDPISDALGIRNLFEIYPDLDPQKLNEIPEDATRVMSGELNPFWGLSHTDEVKERLSKVDKSYMQTEEYRKNMSEAIKKRNAETPRSREWSDNLSKALTGYKKSEEHIANHRKSLVEGGKVAGENNPMYGQKHSQETLDKMSKALKGKFAGENNPMYGKSATKGMKWYNNGKESGRFVEGEQPEGYEKGRLKFKKKVDSLKETI